MSDKNYKKLLDDSRDYLQGQADLLKLDFASKLASVLGYTMVGIAMIFGVVIILIFLGIALANILSGVMPIWLAYLIVAVLHLGVIFGILSYSKKLIIKPIERGIAGIFFGGEPVGGIEHQQERLQQESEQKARDIDADLAAIREELAQPSTIFSIFRNLPTIFTVASTVIPLIKKLRK